MDICNLHNTKFDVRLKRDNFRESETVFYRQPIVAVVHCMLEVCFPNMHRRAPDLLRVMPTRASGATCSSTADLAAYKAVKNGLRNDVLLSSASGCARDMFL